MSFTRSEIEVAIARANGQKLASIKSGALNTSSSNQLGPSRAMGPQKKDPYKTQTGHVYAHVATFAQGSTNPEVKASGLQSAAEKSRWQDRRTVIEAAWEMMQSPQAKPIIEAFAPNGASKPSGPERIQRIPLDGIYYGYESGKAYLREVETGTIVFYIALEALFIYTCYPEDFVAGVKGVATRDHYELNGLFGST